MTAQNWKTGDRVTVDPAQAEGYVQPYRRLIEQGREATLKVDQRHTRFRGTVPFFVVTFDVHRTGGRGHKLELDPKYLRRVPS